MNNKKAHSKKKEGKIKAFFKRRWEVIKSIPWYGWVAGIFFMGLQYGVYRLADVIAKASGTIAWAYCPKIPFDDSIPLVPFFILIYVYSYLFWIMGPIAVSLTKKDNFINFCIGLPASMLVGFVILVAAPTYMDRAAEGLIDVAKQPGFFNWLLGIVYSSDGSNLGFNLLPSFHCMLSLYMYLGVARRKEVSLTFRIYSVVMVILISLSTVFTKQHYVVDIFAGLAIAAIVFFIVKWINPGKRILEKQTLKAKEAK